MQSLKESLYEVLDTLIFHTGIKRTISNFTVKLPLRFHSYFPEDYEIENFNFLKQYCRKGSTVIDIGAHIGLFSVAAAKVIGHTATVYAFEPAPATFNLLRKTINLNGQQEVVKTIPKAVADADGSTFFNVSNINGDNSNSLVEYRKDKNLQKVKVGITSIDNFLRRENISEVKFIKIDAEGYEYGVLKGAKETFDKHRPFAILALHPSGITANGDSLESIYDFVIAYDYRVMYNGGELTRAAFCEKDYLFDVQLIPNR